MAKKDKADKKNKSSKKKDNGERAHSVSTAVTQVARAMRTQLSRGLAESGLYAGQDTVVQLLFEQDGLTPGALAQKLGVKAPTMTRTIGRMEVQGFVERRPDETDQRLTKVYLTESGRNSTELIARAVAACDELALKGFSDKEVRTLVRLLRTLDANLQGEEIIAEDEEE